MSRLEWLCLLSPHKCLVSYMRNWGWCSQYSLNKCRVDNGHEGFNKISNKLFYWHIVRAYNKNILFFKLQCLNCPLTCPTAAAIFETELPLPERCFIDVATVTVAALLTLGTMIRAFHSLSRLFWGRPAVSKIDGIAGFEAIRSVFRQRGSQDLYRNY